jgi:hypothetical protein
MMDPNMVEEDLTRHHEARNGDHLMCPFQCNECQFVNIHKCSSRSGVPQDNLCLVAIRRANLDALWARERATVEANRREALLFISQGESLGFDQPYPPRGPWPVEDIWE